MIVIKLHDNLPSFSSYYYFNFGVNFFVCFAPCLKSFPPRPYPLSFLISLRYFGHLGSSHPLTIA